MRTRQFRVLYRDFLFRIVDRELLSTYAKGDASQLLLQIVALLAFLSVIFSIPALGIDFISTYARAGAADVRVEHRAFPDCDDDAGRWACLRC